MPLRRFEQHYAPGGGIELGADHPAVLAGTTIFPGRVKRAGWSPVLKSGMHSRKIGAVVQKGPWRGFPIFTLTLVERETCPDTCLQWASCYMNRMHWPDRYASGLDLEVAIERDLHCLAQDHPGGFVVRLHIGGDFYAPEYVAKWMRWLYLFPALHVFGYSAWPAGTPIGDALDQARAESWPRFAMRRSGAGGDMGAIVIEDLEADRGDAILCPAQTGKTDCCATCGLCWQTRRGIAFLRH